MLDESQEVKELILKKQVRIAGESSKRQRQTVLDNSRISLCQ